MKQRSFKGRKPGTNPATDTPPKAMSSSEHGASEGEDLCYRGSNFGSRISPSRLTTQVALAVPPEDSYSGSKLHSALTGKLQPHPHLREVAQSSSPVRVPSPGRHLSPSSIHRVTPPTSSPYASPLGVRVSPDVHGILPVKLSPSDRLSPRGSGLPTLSPNLPYSSPHSEAPRSSSSPGPPKMSGPFVRPEYSIPFRPYQGDPMVSAGSRMTAPGFRILATPPEGGPRMTIPISRQNLIQIPDREEQKESSDPVVLPFSTSRDNPTEHRLTEALLRQNIHDMGTLERLYKDYSQSSPAKGTPSPSNKDRLSPNPERVSPALHPKKDLQRRATPPPPPREPTPPSSLLHSPQGARSDSGPPVDLSKLPPKQRVRLMDQQPVSLASQQPPPPVSQAAYQWQEISAPVHQPQILDMQALQQLHQPTSMSHQPPATIPVPVKIPMLIQGQPFIRLPRMPVDAQSGSIKILSGKFDLRAQEALSKQSSTVVPLGEKLPVASDIKTEKIVAQPPVKAEVKVEVPSHQSNPFIFPRSGVKVSPTIPSFNTSHVHQAATPPTAHYPRSRSDISYMKRQDDIKDASAMPQLIPENTLKMKSDVKKTTYQEIEEESKKLRPWTGQFNMRLKNLANFPVNSSSYRSAYRAQSVAVQKAKACSVTGAGKTLDLLRQTLQKTINKEIDAVIQKYVEKFFKVGIANIKENTGPTSVTDEHLNSVCRQVLEEAKKMYVVETRRSVSPVQDFPDNVSDTGSNSGKRWIKKRRLSDSDSEKGGDYIYAKKVKKKGRPLISGRTTPSKIKSVDVVRREGPKWDPERLVSDTLFVMGAKANKALGLGNTRGRLYIKHPDVFKYSGDQEDKQWLYEHHLMPATGGKAYMLIVDDIKDLSETDEYRDGNLLMNELVGFNVPDWMVVKMKAQMQSMRTDKGRFINRSRSATPSEASVSSLKDGEDSSKTLPFSGFSDSPLTINTKPENVASPMDGEMEFLSGTDIGASNMSPFNLTGGFEDTGSPTQSEIDNLDDDPTYTTPFGLSK